MVVSHNLSAINTERQFGIVGGSKKKSTEKLASGFRINRAADDAAGLAVSEKMRRQIRGLSQASKNATDGISMVQTADGGLNEVHEMLQRMNELSVKAANGTLSDEDRQYVDSEIQQLKKEINRVAGSTTFNEIQLFPPDGSSMLHAEYKLRFENGMYIVSDEDTTYNFVKNNVTGNAVNLADKVVNEMLPGIMTSLMGKYRSLSQAPDMDLAINFSYIDGGNGTLAVAMSAHDGAYNPVPEGFSVKIDTADFTDSNALPGGDRYELLRSTLAHELTHTLMRYNLSKSMATEMPKWFTEGSAQVSGGPFNGGWLYELQAIGNTISDTNDTSKDAEIESYLKSYSVDNRVYGHGYLATAYAGYLAAGKDINGIADGLDKIFEKIKGGMSFNDAMQAVTGKTPDQIKNLVNSGDADVVDFSRKLVKTTGNGAGSSVFGLANGDGSPFSGLPADGSTPTNITGATSVFLQVGSEAGQSIEVELFSIGTKSLGLEDTCVDTMQGANDSIDSVKNAIQIISSIRSYYGSIQNRLEHTIKNLDNVVENTTAAESAIRDTDMAKEMVQLSNLNILEQAGVSMMAQANQSNQTVLSLLQ